MLWMLRQIEGARFVTFSRIFLWNYFWLNFWTHLHIWLWNIIKAEFYKKTFGWLFNQVVFLLLWNLVHRQDIFSDVFNISQFFSFMCQLGSFCFSILDNLLHLMPFIELHHFLFSYTFWLSVGADLVIL